MQAVILAAGQGKRLFPLTKDIPKALVPVNGIPMLEIILKQLKKVGITDVVVVIHHLKGQMLNYCEGSPFGMNIRCVEQKEMRGTGDAVLTAEKYITDKKFLCIAVDSLFETSLLEKLLKSDSDGVITCKEVDDPRRYGILVVDGKNVLDIVEKPVDAPSNLANLSVYLFPREIFAACKRLEPSLRGELEVTDAIKMLIKGGKKFTYVKTPNILDIGTQEQLQEAEGLAKKLRLP
ncbi:hypothetical protein COV20_03615 [Candidatus Woesearchaeota archaeon CG10_big_fil_rev_8_21_14_0_10_45_16]|nr:MAG: hypothetical protein COV20_03615 [Candidatus Woesearchaeota archaeon CG10_big_fil_rev_8_21_14_0_10_45_16]